MLIEWELGDDLSLPRIGQRTYIGYHTAYQCSRSLLARSLIGRKGLLKAIQSL